MNTSLKWIKALVPGLDCGVQEYVDAMTLSGSKVEGYEQLDADLDKIVVGQVTKIEKHPDADKLVICQVNVGSETLQIVTGAPNVFEGAKVPVVLDGGRVAGGHDGTKTPGGIKIKKGKLRGVESSGMMCSIEELGSNREMFPDAPENGLYIFDEDAPVGENAVAYLGLDDSVVEYEITSNRVDCFSVLGIAREAAATFHKEFVPPVVTETGNNEDVNDYIKVSVKDQDLCSRYTARVVKNIKFAPSPKWMQERLRAHGIRPINNLVDITNYVMEEYGQPMHAYDLDTIEGKEIIVRRAAAGEKFVTLDGQERQLDENVLMICDAKKAVGIAGIMGGENSMITDHVTTMLFEAACFDGTNIRKSGKRIGLRTDASAKFEKGLDPNLAMEAMNRACQLVEELGVGEVVGGAVDIYPVKREAVMISNGINWENFTSTQLEDLIGQFASETGKKAGEFYTPHGPAQILCRIAMTGQENKKGLQVYDPCMGSGSLMLSCRNYSTEPDFIKYYGQELMPSTYNLARMNMFLHGVLPENQHLRNGDTLDADWPTDEETEFDAVTMNPPYSANWSAAEGFKQDERFMDYGGKLAPKSKEDYAFLLRGFYHLKQTGTMAIVLPHGVLFRGAAEGSIRKTLLENGSIYAVIGLPSNMFYNTSIPTCIIVLKKHREGRDVLFIDASKLFEKEKKQNVMKEEHIDHVLELYNNRIARLIQCQGSGTDTRNAFLDDTIGPAGENSA